MKRWGPWKSSFSLSSLMGLLILMMLFSSSVLASNPQQAAGLDVVASGLDSPRGLTFGPDGALYITEAGVGGEGRAMHTGARWVRGMLWSERRCHPCLE